MKEYVSSLESLCGAYRFTFKDGKAKGCDCIVAHNGVLTLYINPDRGLDILRVEYRGENVAFISKNGEISPSLIGTNGYQFVNSFPGGFLYTCGLDNCMGEDTIKGKKIQQHGTYTYLPAENLSYQTIEENGKLFLIISGIMHYTALFGANIELKRTITLEYGQSSFELVDEITNQSFASDEYIIMYHHNLGYPLLDEHAKLSIDHKAIDIYAPGSNINNWSNFESPKPRKPEEVFVHTINGGQKMHAELANNNHSVSIEWDGDKLPYMIQWKSMACQDYACGIEPTISKYPAKTFKKLDAESTDTYKLIYRFK
ncbi:MAG: DUF4432 family protein [Bacilli bacterium]